MQYQTLFDISTAGYKEWQFALISCLLVAANGVVLLFFYGAKFRKSMHVISVIVVLVTFCMPYWDHSRLVRAYQNHDYRVAEGRVENYWEREWYSRRKKQTYRQEGFTVQGVKFAYSRSAEAGFTNHQDPRIPLRDGMVLRVSYVADQQLDRDAVEYRILKLEKKESSMTNDQLPKTATASEAYQSSKNNASIEKWHRLFVQRLKEQKFELAEIAMRHWLDIPGQMAEAYYFTPAEFYEEWGDAETDSPAIAAVCYEQAIHYRYRTAALATGSGDGAVIMYHVKNIQKKLKRLPITNDELSMR